jgi:nucleoside-diphosphate-sugar epimerase
VTSAANTASPSSYAEQSVSDETVWTDPEDPTLTPYRRSKTVAERAAWDWVAAHDGAPELVTVLPGAVFGPVLTVEGIGSVSMVRQMLSGAMRGVPRIGLEAVDVRDLVAAHLLAFDVPEAAGERFLATGEFIWMRKMATAVREELGADGARVSTRQLPDALVRCMARYRNPALRDIVPALGRRAVHTTAKAERVLGWHARPAREAVVDAGRSLVSLGAV